MNNSADLVLVVSDMNVPFKLSDIPSQFKSLLIPNKIQHVLSLGNMGSKDSYDWLKSLSNDFHAVKGDFDETAFPETKVVTIGDFKIGMIHGHQVVPWGNQESLSTIQKQLGCDILLNGHSCTQKVEAFESKFYINPGSISGSFSYNNPSPVPSFILMVIQGDFTTCFIYELPDSTKEFEVTKMEFKKNSEEIKIIVDKEEEEEVEIEE